MLKIQCSRFSTQDFDPDEGSVEAAGVVDAAADKDAGAAGAGTLEGSGVPSGVFSSLSVDIVDCSKASRGCRRADSVF